MEGVILLFVVPGSRTLQVLSGLFIGFWMSDKPLVQQRLAQDLADVLLAIKPVSTTTANDATAQVNAALDFVAGFWEAIVREWPGIDRLRFVTKFHRFSCGYPG